MHLTPDDKEIALTTLAMMNISEGMYAGMRGKAQYGFTPAPPQDLEGNPTATWSFTTESAANDAVVASAEASAEAHTHSSSVGAAARPSRSAARGSLRGSRTSRSHRGARSSPSNAATSSAAAVSMDVVTDSAAGESPPVRPCTYAHAHTLAHCGHIGVLWFYNCL